MSQRLWLAAPVLAASLISVPQGPVPVTSSAVAPDAAARQASSSARSSTLDDQVDLAVTVYNSSIALVRDVRQIDLPRGVVELAFQDIAATVNPATVHFRSLSEPSRVSVLEQNYQYDLIEPDKLLRKYVGRDVTLVRLRQDGGVTREEAVTARLLSFNSAPVWQIDGEIVTGLHADHIRFPAMPENLRSRPTLIWSLDNAGGARHRIEASYLAGNLSWTADYVLTVARDDAAADVDGWVTLANRSGTSFANASLQLVAGDLNRVRQELSRTLDAVTERAMPAAAPQMTSEAFSDYHLYAVGRRTTIRNDETKQINMLTGTGVPVKKRYVVNGQSFYYRNPHSPGAPITDPVQVFYQLTNDTTSGLGMPMPAGTVRVYQSDARGGVHFVGEDRIGHTPKDEVVNLRIGRAFDVVAERKQVDFQKIATSVYEVEYEVVVRNRKSSPVTVEVNEPIGGTWQIVRSTHGHTKTDAFAAQFMLLAVADGTTRLNYRVRVTH